MFSPATALAHGAAIFDNEELLPELQMDWDPLFPPVTYLQRTSGLERWGVHSTHALTEETWDGCKRSSSLISISW
jgi:hypothetical protein